MTKQDPQASLLARAHLDHVRKLPMQIYVNLVAETAEDGCDAVAVIVGSVGDPTDRTLMIQTLLDASARPDKLIGTASLVANYIALLGQRADEILRFVRARPEGKAMTFEEAVIAFEEAESARRAEAR